jgi:hypothetical protein
MFQRGAKASAVRAVLVLFASLAVGACAIASSDANANGSGSSSSSGDPNAPSGTFDPSNPDASGGDPGATGCAPSGLNVEVANNGCDDDGDGKTDVVASCDDGLAVDGDAEAFARALGVCKKASTTSWGLVSARYVNGFTRATPPADEQHGILDQFGTAIAPREGARLGVLSTGFAREYNSATSAKTPFNTQPQYAMQREPLPGYPNILVDTKGEPPPGWPKAAGGCPALSNETFDLASVELAIKVPANAKGLHFDFDFYSGEWPEWVCSTYNDGFVAMLSSKANKTGTWENISFDAKGNAVSVNFAFFDRCTAGAKVGCRQSTPTTAVCPGGTSELAGTGFAISDDYCGDGTESTGGGATGWLTSEAPVVPGETITLKLMIWDTGDFKYDSSVLLDHLSWVTFAPTATKTERAPDVVK